jgi:phenylalanyl-tRNA synthetase alpha chain
VDAQALEHAALAAVEAATSVDEIEHAQVEFLGRKSELKLALREVRDRETGMALNALRERLESAIDARAASLERADLDRRLTEERVDVTMPGTPIRRGHLHLITQIRREVEDIFLGLGYAVVDGREVETTRYNFDALNFPPGHPTRSPLQTLFLDDETVLRTETSPSQIRTMEAQEPPVYIVTLGRVYRRDTPDATHMPVFHQIEGLVVDRDITMADLAGTIEAFTKAFFGGDFTSRLRPSYFPFTEPSAEFDIRTPAGDWLELGGCGMVHPNVLAAGGLDPEVWSGFAFGFGIDRMGMERHAVGDIREMFTNDIRFLEQF